MLDGILDTIAIIGLVIIGAIAYSEMARGASPRLLSPPPIVGTGESVMVVGDFSANDQVGVLIRYLEEMKPFGRATLVIDSNGGDAQAALALIQAMREFVAGGRRAIVCYVPRKALSAGLYTLLQCTDRYIKHDAKLLWHQARVTYVKDIPQAANDLRRHIEQLDRLNAAFLGMLQEQLPTVDREYLANSLLRDDLRTPEGVNALSPGFAVVTEEMNEALQIINAPRR